MGDKIINKPDKIMSYFKKEKKILFIITVTGILYNIGMVAGPFFEGKLVQKLFDIINGFDSVQSMIKLAFSYIAVIVFVQGMRTFKRFYVRRFANNINRTMRNMLYNSLVFQDINNLKETSAGALMTKAVSDVNACAEGMRKFTTEIFDTGVVLVAYIVMLFVYDIRLAVICCIFPPVAYLFAEKFKTVIYKYNKEYKRCSEKLSDETKDRVSGAILYRISGMEKKRDAIYNETLDEYEKKAIKANVWENSLPPLYLVISSISVIFILYFGSRNVVGTGWKKWDIAAFTTFLACFTKLAKKSSTAAKLFNAVQKASVSWKRIQPLMHEYKENKPSKISQCEDGFEIDIENLSFAYPGNEQLIKNLNFKAVKGEIIGVAGPVACGKSAFGKIFFKEYPYNGSIKLKENSSAPFNELKNLNTQEIYESFIYMGHEPELISASLRENICLGKETDVDKWIQMTCLDEDIESMPDKVDTYTGDGGMTLSGGQQQRLSLARTLSHAEKVMILDDPFSAVDMKTERKIMDNLCTIKNDHIIFIISHRLELFPEFDRIIWIDKNESVSGTHSDLIKNVDGYKEMYNLQIKGKKEAQNK